MSPIDDAELAMPPKRLIAEIEAAFPARVVHRLVRNGWDPSNLDVEFRATDADADSSVVVNSVEDTFWLRSGRWQLDTYDLALDPEAAYELALSTLLRIGQFGLLSTRGRGIYRLVRLRARYVIPGSDAERRELIEDPRFMTAYLIRPWG